MRIAILIVATSLAACINTAPPESADNAVPDSAYYAPTTIAPHFSAVDVQLNVVLETPDGARLLTDVYRPSGIDSSISTVLIRVPYDKQNYTRAWGRFWARRGFNLVLQDVRGRFASATTSDEYEPFVSDIEDARVTVDWIIRQTWSNQKVAVMGASYYGYTALAAAVSKHPAIRCVAPGFTSPDLYETSFRQGALKLSTLGIFWLNMDGDPTTYQDVSRINTRGFPLAGIGATAGLEDRLWSNLIESWDSPAAEFRQSTDLADELLTINIPMLHSTGFYDNILGDHLRLWSRMATAAAVKERQWLLLGPWDHELTTSSTNRVGQLDIGSESRFAYADTIHAFFDFCLNDVENGFDKRPMVSYFTLGKNTWQDADTWPPKNVRFEDWYLSSNGRANGGTDRGKLSKSPSDGAAYDRFKYDPRNPVDLSASYDNWSAARYLPDRRAVEGRPRHPCLP